MLRPVTNIKIGENEFDFVTSGTFTTSWKLLTDTGEITLPHRFKKDNKTIFVGENNIFNKGDYVEVYSGYFPDKNMLFSGFVSSITPSIPVKIKFEDFSWVLKQTNVTLSFKETTLKNLILTAIEKAKNKSSGKILSRLNDIELNVVDAKLGSFRATNSNITKILQELKKTYALVSFFRGNVLNIGLAYSGEKKRHKLSFQENIIDEGTDLEYLRQDDVSFKVKAISMLENNKKIEIEVGDSFGEQRTITKYNISADELKKVAERELTRIRYEGFRGQVRTFLDYPVKHGDEVEVLDNKNSERNGVYFAEQIEYEIGVNGSFQNIKLGAKIG